MSEHFDAIVIGAGQAGPPLCERLDQAGMKTVLIERHLLGGTCVNTGCIPTKALIASARAAQLARRGPDFGFDAGDVRVDMAAVKRRKDEIVRQSSEGVATWIERMSNVSLVQGHARFTAPRTVVVGERSFTADRVFLDVGSRAAVPEMPGVDSVPFFTNSSMMDIDFLPEHLVIVGGSYIGLEFAQMYRRFGSRVTVVERGERLIPREDDEVCDEIRAILEREGIEVRTGADCIALGGSEGKIEVRVNCDNGAPVVHGTHLLLAVGRKPNTDDLGLDQAGIETDERGHVVVDDQCRSSADGVWAMGDANGRGAFTHTSYNDYEIVAANLFDDDPRSIADRIDTYALFIDPPLARAGLTEKTASENGIRLLVGTMPMSRVGRARESSETQGFMKVLVDAQSNAIVGAALLGMNADEVVHSLLDVMYANAPYTTMRRAVHIHPTVSELLPTLLGQLEAREP